MAAPPPAQRRAWWALAALSLLFFHITAATFTSLGVVLPRMVAEPLADNKLVNAWRNTVHRNRFQPKFDVLESLLKDTLAGPGAAAAVAAFPKLKNATATDIIDSLRAIGVTPKQLDQYVVNDLIKQALPAATPAPQQQPKP